MADLSLSTRDSTKERGDHGDHAVIFPVLGDLAVGEVHALGQTSVAHLLLASLNSDPVEALVHEEQECDFHETSSAQDVANIEDPIEAMDIRVAVSDPDVQGRSNHHDGHLKRQEVSFEETVEEIEDALPVGFLEGVMSDIGKGTVFSWWRLSVDLTLGDVNIGGTTQGTVDRAERPRSVLPVLPKLDDLAHSITRVQSTPHVTNCLLVSSLDIGDQTLVAVASTTGDVALADGADDSSHGEVTVEGEETLQIHVQILANGFGVAVPTTNTINQLERDRVDGRGRCNGRAAVKTRQSSGGPENVGNANQGWNAVRITIKDNWRRVQGRIGGVGEGQVHGSQVGKVIR